MSAFAAMSAVAPATIAAPARRVAPAAKRSGRRPHRRPPIALHASRRREQGRLRARDGPRALRPHRHLSHRRSLRLQVKILRACFSEYALVRARVIVEVRWLQKLAAIPEIVEVPPCPTTPTQFLEKFLDDFSPADAAEVKKVERTTNHDVKAVEYVIKDSLVQHPELKPVMELVHFACTSKDINNLSHALMLRSGVVAAITPFMDEIVSTIAAMAKDEAETPMMSRTHGQPASPTTLGKEFANVAYRLAPATRADGRRQALR